MSRDVEPILAWMRHGFRIGYEPAAEGGRQPPYVYWEPGELRHSPRLTMTLFETLRERGLIERASPNSDQFVLSPDGRAPAGETNDG